VPLVEIHRTTSFRLALLFLLLFGAASLALFGFLYLQTTGHLRAQVDGWLRREQTGFMHLDREAYLERLAARKSVDPTVERPFTLFDPAGHRTAGTPLDLAPEALASMPIDRLFDFKAKIGDRQVTLRGLVRRVPPGNLLLIAQDLTDTAEFDELLVHSFLWGGLVTLALGLAGAAIAGKDAVRRIDAVTRATERIVDGDLSQRLPARGRVGDLDRLSHVINGMLGEIEHLMKEVKGVGDNIAHDLRTPLTRLLAGLERARRRATAPAEYVEAIDDAVVEVRGILDTFSALLRIAEVESGARRAGFTAVDLSTVAADIAEFYEPMAEEKGITLQLSRQGAGAASMPGDPSLLFEAAANLVDNALKYTPRGGCVTVRSFGGEGRTGFEVIDNGPGIPAAERELVLRRFHRIEESRNSPGTGLGLALVTAVARLHGMEITFGDAVAGCWITLTWIGKATEGGGLPS
jgi:signal transduction histidine kinase